MRCSDSIHPPSPTLFRFPYQPTLCPRPTPTIKEKLCYLNILRCVAFYWSMIYLSVAMPLEKTDLFSPRSLELSISPRLGVELHAQTALPFWNLVWFRHAQVLWLCQNCCEFLCAASLLCPEDTPFLSFIHPLPLALTLCTLPQRLALGKGSVLCIPL